MKSSRKLNDGTFLYSIEFAQIVNGYQLHGVNGMSKSNVITTISSIIVWLFASANVFADYDASVQAWESGNYPEAVAERMVASNAATQTAERAAASSAGKEIPELPAEVVQVAQSLLKSLGYSPGPADGIWGRKSATAYRAFLQDAGLPASDTLNPIVVVLMHNFAEKLSSGTD